MKKRTTLFTSIICLLAVMLNSCGTSSFAKIKKITPKIPRVKSGDIARFSFGDLMPGQIPVVAVDQAKLVRVQSGKDKALAYQESQSNWPSWLGNQADFKEPELPTDLPLEADYGLLPPKPN